MNDNNVTWAPHIPLIGGFPLGAERAIGTPPKLIASLDGFWANDQHYVNYQNNTLGRDISYNVLNPEDKTFKEKVNIIVSTPPCAGLSQLNTGKNEEVKGANCQKNEFMYIAAEQGIHCYDADVIMIENAPTLYTSKGQPVADKLYDIARKNNYSMTLYRTSTIYHGLPQRRDRTFAILWKSKTAPIMDFIKRKQEKTFEEYIADIPKSASLQSDPIRKDIMSEPYYNFLQAKLQKHDVRDDILESSYTAHAYVVKHKLMEEFVEWAKDNHEKGYELGVHAMKKFADGKGVWDGSVHVFKDHMNAVIGRALAESIHPNQDRSLNIREALYMMGFPHNFELIGGRKNLNHIAQNVPTYTACDMVEQAAKFVRGELMMSNDTLLKQNNHKHTFDLGSPVTNDLTAFF